MFKTVRNSILIFAVVLVLGFCLMIVTYSIPSQGPHDIIVEDAPAFVDLYPKLISKDRATQLDLFSDAIILSEVAYYNKNVSVIDNAMSVYGIRDDDFQEFAQGNESVIDSYPRYWHGNLFVFKVLFSFLDYGAVKILNLLFEIVLIFGISKLMYDGNLKSYIIPFLLSLCLIHPEAIGLCLQFASVFNVMLVSVFILLRFREVLLKNNRMVYYFLVIGMLTSYLDLLSYPLITFGVPMIFYVLLEQDKMTLRENILKIVLFGASWSIGYLGMWVGKWIIGSILLNQDIIANGVNTTLFRMSNAERVGEGVAFSILDPLRLNLSIYFEKVYLIVFALIGVYYLKRLWPLDFSRDNLKNALPLVIISLIPFLWYVVVVNHSSVHYWFTYRILVIFFFALMCGLEYVRTIKS